MAPDVCECLPGGTVRWGLPATWDLPVYPAAGPCSFASDGDKADWWEGR